MLIDAYSIIGAYRSVSVCIGVYGSVLVGASEAVIRTDQEPFISSSNCHLSPFITMYVSFTKDDLQELLLLGRHAFCWDALSN
jgi:hypothetical protein